MNNIEILQAKQLKEMARLLKRTDEAVRRYVDESIDMLRDERNVLSNLEAFVGALYDGAQKLTIVAPHEIDTLVKQLERLNY